jgi:hypothetical protein
MTRTSDLEKRMGGGGGRNVAKALTKRDRSKTATAVQIFHALIPV